MRRTLLPLLLVAACSGDVTSTETPGVALVPGARAEFTAYPVDMTADGTIEPLGHLAPPGHTIPTDHVYFYPIDYDKPFGTRDTITRTVYAPAAGTVFFMLQPVGTDWKIMFQTTKTFAYYLDHVIPRAGLKVGDMVKAGEVIGKTNPGSAIDLGAYDTSTPAQPFVKPERYGDATLYCVSPFKYFVEPMRSAIYARQRRLPSAPLDPPIAFDKAGTLAGNWYEQSLPVTMQASNGPLGWPKSLAFVYDNRDPAKVRVSIGGTIAQQGIWTIDADAPRPEAVTMASGKVAYRLRYTESTNVQSALLIVQMIAADRIRVQVFEGSQLGDAEFDARASVYLR